MNKLSRWIALSAFSLALIPFISGCGESESSKQIKETSTTTSYAQPAPAPATIVSAPPSRINTTEEKSSSHSTDVGNNSTPESTDGYHSASTPRTPAPTADRPPARAPPLRSQPTAQQTDKKA